MHVQLYSYGKCFKFQIYCFWVKRLSVKSYYDEDDGRLKKLGGELSLTWTKKIYGVRTPFNKKHLIKLNRFFY